MTDALESLRARGPDPDVLVLLKVGTGESGMKDGSGLVMGREDLREMRAPSEASKVVYCGRGGILGSGFGLSGVEFEMQPRE